MTTVIADISMSLDGFVTGPEPDMVHGLGIGGEALHTWALGTTDEVDVRMLRESVARTGAVVMGRRLFDFVDGPHGWNDELGYGAEMASAPPFIVVTHTAPVAVRLGLDFTFVTTGLAAALDQARAAAAGRDVIVMGGADVIRQCLDAALLDELRIHLAPVVLGAGTPLFAGSGSCQLVQRSVEVSATATHLTYQPRQAATQSQ